MNILFIGDIVGKPGRNAVANLLPDLKEEFNIDLVIANAENAAGGSGITPRIANDLFKLGCNVLTLGDHVWDRQEIRDYLTNNENILRPANFPDETTPGRGYCLTETKSGKKVAIINLLGRVFMRYNITCPFRTLEKIVEDLKNDTSVILVDMHAEATSEKIALGHFINGRVSAVLGSHTHVQTADEIVLSQGTAYITDSGMTGPHDSVIGQDKNIIIKRFLTSMPSRFEVASNDTRLNGVVVDIDEVTGKAKSIIRIQKRLSDPDGAGGRI